MGYVAYAVGTLIAAVAIHSLYRRRFKVDIEEQLHGSACASLSEIRISEAQRDEKARDHATATPLIAVEKPHIENDSQHKDDTSSSSDRSDSPPRGSHVSQEEEADTAAQSVPKTQLSRIQPQGMPPPPRPSSAPNLNSLAAQARQRAVMPPPSSLPPSRGRSPPRLKPATASLVPPRPGPGQGGFSKPTGFSSSLLPTPSAASTLRIPQQRVLANTHMQPSLAPSISTQPPSKRSSKKIMLTPGHSPLDWAALTRSTSPTAPAKLRGSDATSHLGLHRLGRITPSQLKHQNGRKGKDAWTVYQGKVYNISAYLSFHPGGEDELMKGAGRSSDTLFAEVHPWVNWDGMLQSCMIGILVGEDDAEAIGERRQEKFENGLDEMD